ncbi:MAG: helix-turn-helix domain-containing protein [Lentisphaeria bacterium]|nr:MAG: helix-turn-helix domain-containing protein [Lentisphaeria bacterium]
MSVKEIAGEMGFDNEYYFSRFFKRHLGLPPGSSGIG